MPIRPTATIALDASPLPRAHLARDFPASTVRAKLARREWVRIRPGAFVTRASVPAPKHDALRYVELARIDALSRQLRLSHTYSHTSAALLWGLPTLDPPTSTHIIQESRPSPRSARDVVRHVSELRAEDITTHRDVPVTSLNRTIVDCAALLGVRAGLIVADAALRVGAHIATCESIAGTLAGRHGAPAVRAVLRYADAGAESAGETLTRLEILLAGLPEPVTQVEVATAQGTFWGDIGWPEARVLVEFDGRTKYAQQGNDADAVYREKRREDAIRAAGWIVIRVSWSDLERPEAFIRRLFAALRSPEPVPRVELRR